MCLSQFVGWPVNGYSGWMIIHKYHCWWDDGCLLDKEKMLFWDGDGRLLIIYGDSKVTTVWQRTMAMAEPLSAVAMADFAPSAPSDFPSNEVFTGLRPLIFWRRLLFARLGSIHQKSQLACVPACPPGKQLNLRKGPNSAKSFVPQIVRILRQLFPLSPSPAT